MVPTQAYHASCHAITLCQHPSLGYVLFNPAMQQHTLPVLPEPEVMEAQLRHKLPQFSTLEWVEHTDSTNADLMQRTHTDEATRLMPWLRGAHHQRAGRGRAGRTWQNRRGAHLMFSCAFDFFLPPRDLPALSPLAGLWTCQALRTFLQPEHQSLLTVKWPNDLLWKNAKLAGILVEATRAGTARLSTDHHIVVIGTGINLSDARSLSTSLNRQVADWSEISGQDTLAAHAQCSSLVAQVVQHWYNGLNMLISHGLADLPQQFATADGLLGQSVAVTHNEQTLHHGTACGVNSYGQLILRSTDGEHAISVGEVSVRPR